MLDTDNVIKDMVGGIGSGSGSGSGSGNPQQQSPVQQAAPKVYTVF